MRLDEILLELRDAIRELAQRIEALEIAIFGEKTKATAK